MATPVSEGFGERERRVLDAVGRAMIPDRDGFPGAGAAGVADRLVERSRWWDPAVVKRVTLLLRVWDLSSLFSGHLRRFSRLDPRNQSAWVETCYRSRVAARRLQVAALKQLVFLQWASTPEAEEALGYDYRCRRDDEPRGAGRAVAGRPGPVPVPPEPADYVRLGPAVDQGAIPRSLTRKHDFRPVPAEDMKLETVERPDIECARLTSDAVVIGSGAGGAVVAATLAEAGLDVVVLEEGPHVTSEGFTGPMFDRFQRLCRDNAMTQVWGMPPIPLPLGKVVGGTTVVNSGTCFRAPRRVLEQWASELGVDGARLDEMTPHYEAVESFMNVRPVPWELLGPNGMAAHRGAVALGYSGGPLLRNIADCHGCGQCAFGCPTDAKQAMHITYLPRAWRSGARIYSRCRVDRVVVEGGRARGVEASLLSATGRRSGALRVDAPNVIVSAGAVQTPVLLAHSGVPDASGQTGRNLRIHPATGVGAVFDEDVVNWKGTLQSYYIDQFFDSHDLMFEATTTVPSIGAGSIPSIGQRAVAELEDFRKLATLGFYVSDTSSGRVRRLPNGEVLATYRMNDVDARRMAVGVAVAAEVLLEAGATRVYPGMPGIDAISAREDLVQVRERAIRPKHLRLTAFHPMGTVRMGPDPERSAVDSYGLHHSVRGLWVADASTLPTCVGVNPQMTIMEFAKRTAERLVETCA